MWVNCRISLLLGGSRFGLIDKSINVAGSDKLGLIWRWLANGSGLEICWLCNKAKIFALRGRFNWIPGSLSCKFANYEPLYILYHVTNPWDSANPINLMQTLGFKNNYAKRWSEFPKRSVWRFEETTGDIVIARSSFTPHPKWRTPSLVFELETSKTTNFLQWQRPFHRCKNDWKHGSASPQKEDYVFQDMLASWEPSVQTRGIPEDFLYPCMKR